MDRDGNAVACFDAALAADPGYAKAVFNKGNSLERLGRHEEALSCYDTVLAGDPDDGHALAYRGRSLASLERHEEAAAACGAALKRIPGYGDVRLWMADSLSRIGRHGEALDCIDVLVGAEPDNKDALLIKGGVLARSYRCREAVECYDRVLELEPGNEGASHCRSLALGMLDTLGRAAGDITADAVAGPEGPELLAITRILYDQGVYGRVVESVDKLLVQSPGDPVLMGYKGSSLARLGRHAEAVECFDAALGVRPDGDLLYEKGRSLASLGRHAEAAACYEEARAGGRDPGKVSGAARGSGA